MPDHKLRPENLEDALGASLRMTPAQPGPATSPAAPIPPAAPQPVPVMTPVITPPAMPPSVPPAMPTAAAPYVPQPQPMPASTPTPPMPSPTAYPPAATAPPMPGATMPHAGMPNPTQPPVDPYGPQAFDARPMTPTAPASFGPGSFGYETSPSMAPGPMPTMETEENPPARWRRYVPWMTVLCTLLIFGGIVAWAYRASDVPTNGGSLPIIAADPGPVKIKPAQEGGLQVPNQDKEIYTELGGNNNPAGPEHILPVPETPNALPPSPATQGQDGASASGATTPQPPAPAVTPATPPSPSAASGTDTSPAPVPVTPVQPETPSNAAQTAAGTPGTPPAVNPTTPAQPETPQPIPAKAFKVQLASLKSEADAKKQWAILSKKHAASLGKLQPAFVKAEVAGVTYYRIQVGPLADKAAADALCNQLKAQKQPCLTVKP